MNSKHFFRYLLTLLFLSFSFASQAQELKVTPLKVLTGSIEARYDTTHVDSDGIPCALIKVSAPKLDGIKFSSNYLIESSYDSGVYYLWVADGIKNLKYQHPDYVSGTIEFEIPVESKTVYMIVLQASESQIDTERMKKEVEQATQNALREINEAKEKAKENYIKSLEQGRYERRNSIWDVPYLDECIMVGLYSRFSSSPFRPCYVGINSGVLYEQFCFGLKIGKGVGSTTLYWQSVYTDTKRLSLDPKYIVDYEPYGEFELYGGFPMSISDLVMIPSVGIRAVSVAGTCDDVDVSQSFCVPAIPVSIKFHYSFDWDDSPVVFSVTPEYLFPLRQGEVCRAISGASDRIAGWTKGFGLNFAVSLNISNL